MGERGDPFGRTCEKTRFRASRSIECSLKYRADDKTIRRCGAGAEALNALTDEECSQLRQSPANTWATMSPGGHKGKKTQRKNPPEPQAGHQAGHQLQLMELV